MGRQVVVDIIGDSTKFGHATDAAISKTTSLNGKLGTVGKGIALGAGIGAFNLLTSAISAGVGMLDDARQAFLEDEASANRLAGALKNNVPGWNGSTAAAEAYAGSLANVGVSDDQARDAIAKLVGVTHSQREAMNLTNLAIDLARAKNIDLEKAVGIVTKAHEGNGKALKSLGVDIGTAKTGAELLDAIQKNVAGSAERWAATNEGKLAASNVKVGEAMETVGAAVTQVAAVAVPLLADALTATIKVFGDIWKAAQPFITQLAATLLPIIKQVATFFISTLVPAAMKVGQTVLSILVPAVKTAIDVLSFLWRAIQPVVQALLSVLVPAFKAVASFVSGTIIPIISQVAKVVMPALQTAIRLAGPIIQTTFNNIAATIRLAGQIVGTAVNVMGTVIKTVAGAIGTAINTVRGVINTQANAIGTIFRGIGTVASTLWTNIRTVFNGIVSTVGGIPGRIASIARGMWDSIWNGFRSVVNSIIRGWNSISFSIPRVDLGPLGTFGGFSIGTPNLPLLHTGGVVPGVPGSTVFAALQAGEEVRSRLQRDDGAGVQVIINGNVYGGPAGLDQLAADIAWRLRLQGVTR